MLPRPCPLCGGGVLQDGDGKEWGLTGPRWVCSACGLDNLGRRKPTPAERRAVRKDDGTDPIEWSSYDREALADLLAIDAGATLKDLEVGGPAWKRRRERILGLAGNGHNGNGNGNGHKPVEELPMWLTAGEPDLSAPVYGQLAFSLVSGQA